MVKIAFWDNCLNERGTSLALFDYAYYNKKLLGNESIIIFNSTNKETKANVIQKFQKEFPVFGVKHFGFVDNILVKEKCDIIYVIKSGENEGHISKKIKTVVHCVFNYSQPHGNVYAGISQHIKGYKNGYPVVPHMVNLPNHDKNMREKLSIPEDAIVYGRYGGYDSFDIPYVYPIVYNVAKEKSWIYFIFMNTQKFCDDLPNIIHLPASIDPDKKVEFINTCDAMLHAREIGESFGLSIAEFSSKNKPVISTPNIRRNPKVDRAHIHFLGNKGVWYNEYNLYTILTTFLTKENKNDVAQRDWNAFKDYTPEIVTDIFNKVFIINKS